MGNLIQTIIRVTKLNMMKFFQLILIFGMFAAISSKSVNNVAEEDEGEEEEYYEDYYEEYNDEFYNYLEDTEDDEYEKRKKVKVMAVMKNMNIIMNMNIMIRNN